MSEYIQQYIQLLIFQYQDKPNARAHIEAVLTELNKVYDLFNQFEDAFDLDLAVGKQLDILGRIVGVQREVPLVIPKRYFGFDDNPNSFPFGDKFISVSSNPFRDKFEPDYTDGQLNDSDYRFFIRARAIKNNAKSMMIDPVEKLSLQDAVDFLFRNKAYIVDNQNMTMTIYIDISFDLTMLQYIRQLDLIPRPQAVPIDLFIRYDESGTFGFEENPNSLGFGDKFNTAVNGGVFANKIL